MSAGPAPRPFDFHDLRRLAPHVQRSLARWQTEACTLASEAWTALGTYPLQAVLGAASPQRTTTALSAAADPTTGILFRIGPAKLPALLIIDPLLLQGIFADLLGAAEVGESSHAELTPLEDSLLEAFLSRLRESLSDSWPGDAPLPCAIHELCRPRRTRRLASHDEVISIVWRIECRFQAGDLRWLIPRRDLEALLAAVQTPPETEPRASTDFSELVEQFPLDITIDIGQATIGTAAMTQLNIGDVLILDQPLGKPLTARVSGQPTWLVQPCRVGLRQAVEIQSLLEN